RSTGQAAPQHQRNQAVSYRHSLNQNQRNGITQKASKPVGFSNQYLASNYLIFLTISKVCCYIDMCNQRKGQKYIKKEII
ncbi:hypothetical protein, partial [Komagataeibacter sp. FXV3]|uniref:hypothetical protein n=1 Tax=Komagataeibacter sp. FXV3 TaxID=2608998 RepID=UPI001D10AF3B